MKTELLTLLRNAQDYLSGQELCSHFQVSRTAVWKVINQLKEEGYEIEAIQNKGYRMNQAPDTITSHELESRLVPRTFVQEIHSYESLNSTNSKAKQLAEEGALHGTLVICESQTAGRGRRGRSWVSTSGEGIFMTLLLRPSFSPSKASQLTLLMALAVAKALKQHTQGDIAIKWPNDLLFNGKKVVGILTEMSAEVDYIHYVVIGVGINVNTTALPEELKDQATSLFLETGLKLKRADLIEEIILQFEQEYERFLVSQDLSFCKEDYMQYLINKDKAVRILSPNEEWEGIAMGINEKGELLVQKKDGNIVEVYAGEVSVRGLFGYAK